jgi:hypothetical protein
LIIYFNLPREGKPETLFTKKPLSTSKLPHEGKPMV